MNDISSLCKKNTFETLDYIFIQLCVAQYFKIFIFTMYKQIGD